jgi:hypothetical protein
VRLVLALTLPHTLGEASDMSQRHDLLVGRRHVIQVLTGLAAATAATTAPFAPATADSEIDSDKRKARYRADSPEVQTYYRVNRYPER